MKEEQVIKDWRGKIIGYVEILDNGNKILRDFYRRIIGRYDKSTNMTKDFYGRLVARGDQLMMLLNTRE